MNSDRYANCQHALQQRKACIVDIRIVVFAGNRIGPEMLAEAVKVLQAFG